ncbi:hypothetical protein G4Z16_20095 [Streptomyces bathyalis]|uniref:Uncharacterized protein n=1 Tax=Streptomyces bathyalis TaxID=2710756 RepID=A0A7T1T8G5_9ACTN|nr:hypothetical protein [Streptomyces bathyalis]QPP08315.1 hypothetical protein G4Z16_20095 [Streptomyces bathyalis]
MANLSAWDQEWLRVQRELRESVGVEVINEVNEPAFAENSHNEAADLRDEASVDSSLYRKSVRITKIGSQWQTVEPYPFVTGEFYLTPLTDVVWRDPPDFTSLFYTEREERVGKDLRVIDACPFTGAGSFSAIRLRSSGGNPELWFSDHRRGLWRMELDYTTYMDLLRLTKGVFGWQHLFTRAPLGHDEFQTTVKWITRMLDALPRLFPDYDYSPLQERLEARL